MLKVFMAEDDKMLARVYEKIFEFNGYQLDVAFDGEQAISYLRSVNPKPGVVLLDVMMPHKDGFSVMEDMKKDSALKDIPVLFLTNLYAEKDEKKGLDMGAEAYLVKSQFIPQEIVDKVKEVCEKCHIK